jgi:hypothetical protein
MVNFKATKEVVKEHLFGGEHIVVKNCGVMIDDSVMNGILYRKEDNDKLVTGNKGVRVHAPADHPEDSDGNFISSSSVEAIKVNYIGCFFYNVRKNNDVVMADLAIDPEVANNSEDGRELLRRVNSGEDIDLSTGLLLNLIEESGYGSDGEEYNAIAINMVLDHIAILLNKPGAATSLQGVGAGIYANSDGSNVDTVTIATNETIAALNMPLADEGYEYNAVEAVERIKAFTNSIEKPSTNYRRFFLNFDRSDVHNFNAYKLPYADIIDGVPHAVLSAFEQAKVQLENSEYNEEQKLAMINVVDAYDERFGIINKIVDKLENAKDSNSFRTILNKLLQKVVGSKGMLYSFNYDELSKPNTEDSEMDKLILAALNKAGVDASKMDADQMLAAYNSLLSEANKSEEDANASNSEENATDNKVDVEAIINAAVAPLVSKIESLETQANASATAERDALALKVSELNVGIDVETAKTLNVNKLKDIITASGGDVNVNVTSHNHKKDDGLAELPSFDV